VNIPDYFILHRAIGNSI